MLALAFGFVNLNKGVLLQGGSSRWKISHYEGWSFLSKPYFDPLPFLGCCVTWRFRAGFAVGWFTPACIWGLRVDIQNYVFTRVLCSSIPGLWRTKHSESFVKVRELEGSSWECTRSSADASALDLFQGLWYVEASLGGSSGHYRETFTEPQDLPKPPFLLPVPRSL